MGMYTKIEMKARLDPKTPKEIVEFLRKLTSDEYDFVDTFGFAVPDHEFFQTDRWRQVFRGMTYGFDDPHGSSLVSVKGGNTVLTIQAEIKSYDGEIRKFIDWIAPYIKPQHDAVGYTHYEEDRKREPIFFKDKKHD